MNAIKQSLVYLVLLSVFALTSCTAGSRAASRESAARSVATPLVTHPVPIAVEVSEVKADVKSEQLIPAVLSTGAMATVLAQRDGVIVQLHSREGAAVAKGQELARISDDDLIAQFEQAQLEVNRSLVEERQLDAMVKVNQSEFEQDAVLFKDGLTSKRQLDRTKNKLEGSVQELEKTRLATQTARSRVEAAKVEVNKCIIRAPISGVVTHRYAALGTSIIRNEKLFEVAQLSRLEVKFQLPQSDHRQFGPGHLLSLSLAGSDRIVAQARICQLDPVADATSNTRGYLADVIGGSGLIPGFAVTVHLPGEKPTPTFWVPRAVFPARAALQASSPNVLFVLDGNRAKSRAVWINAIEGDQVAIDSGLAAGDLVILSPGTELKAGDLVHVR